MKHTIICMAITGILIIGTSALLWIRFYKRIYTIDPYWLICSLISSVGLFLTAFVSMIDRKGSD